MNILKCGKWRIYDIQRFGNRRLDVSGIFNMRCSNFTHMYCDFKEENKVFISKGNNSVPQCHAGIFYRDSRRRILKLAGGEKQWLVVRRFRCRFCNKLHTEMLDCVS